MGGKCWRFYIVCCCCCCSSRQNSWSFEAVSVLSTTLPCRHTHTQLDTVESNSCAKLVNWLVFSVFSWTNTATGLVVVFLFSTGWSMTLFFLSTESKFSLSLNGRRAFAILCWQKGNDNPSLCDDLLNKQKYSCFGGCFDCIYLTSNSYSLANKRLDSRRFYVTS